MPALVTTSPAMDDETLAVVSDSSLNKKGIAVEGEEWRALPGFAKYVTNYGLMISGYMKRNTRFKGTIVMDLSPGANILGLLGRLESMTPVARLLIFWNFNEFFDGQWVLKLRMYPYFRTKGDEHQWVGLIHRLVCVVASKSRSSYFVVGGFVG